MTDAHLECVSSYDDLSTHDRLDLAQMQLDEAEKLFFAGEHDAALRVVRSACDLLEGVR